MKRWICDFFEGLWYDFKDDPFTFIFMIIVLLLIIFMVVLFIYAAATGQIKSDDGLHGINWVLVPSGKGVSMVPIPY